MAEIPIEKKERSNLLPLILGALVLLALLGWWATRNRGETPVVTSADTTASAGAVDAMAATGGSAAITEFVNYTTARDTARETEGNHQYTAGGVRHLAAALEGVAGSNPSIQVYADSMRSSVDRLQRSANSDVHADDAKAAFSAAVSAMEQIDRARGRTRDVAPMRAIYNQLNSRQPLLPQLATVQRFFEAAREALQAMGAAA